MKKWTVIYTDHKNEFIHYEHIKKYNPNAKTFLVDISNNFRPHVAWANSDIFIREWFKNNLSKIDSNSNIALLEWDVLVTKPLPNINFFGLLGKDILFPNENKNWPHWKQNRFLDKYEKYAAGIVPFGFILMDYNTLIAWLDERFDFLYKKNIQNELRLGTILNSQNIKMSQWFLPNVSWNIQPSDFSKPDIYHPVKHKIPILGSNP
jgi:hypothetical protein